MTVSLTIFYSYLLHSAYDLIVSYSMVDSVLLWATEYRLDE